MTISKTLSIAVKRATLKVAVTGLVPFLSAAPVHGQQAESNVSTPAAARGVEEVLVTARRREESIQDVPVAVTAFNAEQLKSAGIVDMEDLRYSVPSLIISGAPSGPSVPAYTLRSQRQFEGLMTQDGSVVVYQAGVAQGRMHGANQAMFDTESVQVLKGPQGTLFGRNTTGGAVIIEPAKPTENLEGEVSLGFGNYGSRNAEGMLNVPLSDTVLFRAAASWIETDGFSLNPRSGKRHDNQDSLAGRASLTWKPSDSVEIYTMVQSLKSDDAGTLQTPIASLPINLAGLGGPEGLVPYLFNGINPNPACIAYMGGTNPNGLCSYDTQDYAALVAAARNGSIRTVASEVDPMSKTNRLNVTNIATVELGGVTLKNIFGYSDLSHEVVFDFDGTEVPGHASLGDLDAEQFSNEFQILGSSFDDRLDWITGLFYFKEDGHDTFYTRNLDAYPLNVNLPSISDGDVTNTSYSAFAQGNYKFESVPGLSATLGARYTVDEREIVAKSRNAAGCRVRDAAGVQLSPCAAPRDATFREPSWTVGLEYKIDQDAMVYLAHRRGYRSGGFNLRGESPAQLEPFNSELVNDIELGSKVDWSLGSISGRTNIALYHQWYEDIQRNVNKQSNAGVTSVIISTIVNAAEATVYGGELETTIFLTDDLEFSLSYAASIPRYDDFQDATYGDLSNNKFSGAPEHTGTATVRYKLPVPSSLGRLTMQADYYASSAFEFWDFNHPLARQKSFDLLGFSADWREFAGTGVDLRLFVKNALGKDYFTSGTFVNAFGTVSGFAGPPRTYGASLTYKF